MAGLLAAAIAGGVQGGGEASRTALAEQQKVEGQKELAAYAAEVNAQKAQALAALQNKYTVARDATANEYQKGRDATANIYQTDRDKAAFTQADKTAADLDAAGTRRDRDKRSACRDAPRRADAPC